jgi:photosystem II stability/assembly factor-like uncharacterized protein
MRRVEGAGWEQIGQDNDYMGFAAHPTETGVLYTSGHPGPGSRLPNPVGLRVSRDVGKTWENVSLAGQADFHTMAVSPANPSLIYGINSHDGGLYRSGDGGQTWDNFGASEAQVFSLTPHPVEPRTVFAATADGLLVSHEAAQPGTWEFVSETLERAPVTAVALHPDDPSMLYAFVAVPGLGLMRSRDGGADWERVGLSLAIQEVGLYISISPANPDLLYVATNRLNIYRSTGGGTTWASEMELGEAVESTGTE